MNILGVNVINIVMTAGIGALAVFAIDKLMKIVIVKFLPQILAAVLKWVTKLDDDVLDKFKKKYNSSGSEVEKQLAGFLRKAADIIEDK